MSWLARSIANSLHLDDDDGDEENNVVPNKTHLDSSPTNLHQIPPNDEQTLASSEIEENGAQSRGVKEDLTEFKQTLTRQFWGVASFLAPQPTAHDNQQVSSENFDESGPSDQSDEEDPVDSAIGDRFENGTSKMASNFFPFGSEENEGEHMEGIQEEVEELSAVGITDEVLAFSRNVAHHPETWLDFPLDEEEDLNDFNMSDAQKEHALAIQHLAPRLAALRIELCPCLMSENYFWKVYFVLLHSRLNKHDAETLSTPQVMLARAMWMQELQKQTKPETEWFGRNISYMEDSENGPHEDLFPTSPYLVTSDIVSPRTYASEPSTSAMTTDYENEKHPIESTEIQFIDEAVIDEKQVVNEDKNLFVCRSSKIQIPTKIQIPNCEDDDDDDDWLEEDLDLGGHNGTATYVGNEDDFSFSDLEEDICLPLKSKISEKAPNL